VNLLGEIEDSYKEPRDGGVPAEIRTDYLLNTSLERYL
jgi:hypothetical protein